MRKLSAHMRNKTLLAAFLLALYHDANACMKQEMGKKHSNNRQSRLLL
jgi:hypothetical protein